MSVTIYPVPATQSGVEELVAPFIENTVEENGLLPGTQFLIVLFGDPESQQEANIEDAVRTQSAVARQTLELQQLQVSSIDERRLNTFTTSLLFNLLEARRDASLDDDLASVLDSDTVSDEDERKIDYYLPRAEEKIAEFAAEQEQAFEERLDDLFPVTFDENVRTLYDRLEDDIVTYEPTIDLLYLAAASTEDTEGVRNLLEHIRTTDIEDEGYLSGGEGGVAGYLRVITNAYSLADNDFNEVFQTARRVYNDAQTSALISLLNDVDTSPDITELYDHTPPARDLISNQYGGSDQDLATRILRTVNGARVIGHASEEVIEEYEEARKEFEKAIADTTGELESLQAHNQSFGDDRIIGDPVDVDRFQKLLQRVEATNSVVLKYLFGVEREKRTSVYETLTYRLGKERDRLQTLNGDIQSRLDDIERLENDLQNRLAAIESAYENIQETSVQISLPDQDSVQATLEAEWLSTLQRLKEDLPEIDAAADKSEIENQLADWDERIEETEEELEKLSEDINRLKSFRDNVESIESKREEIRQTMQNIESLMEGSS